MLMLFFTVALVRTVVLMSLGPDFFFISQAAVNCSRREVMMGMLGTTCGAAVWTDVALSGLHLIIEKMAWPYTTIMVGGELYLHRMDYQMLRGTLKKQDVAAPTPQVELTQNGRSFLKGLLTNLASPKVIICFGSAFSLFASDNVGMGAHWRIFALIIAEILARFAVVASLFVPPETCRGYQHLAKWIDGFTGALFVGFDIHLIISR